MSSRARAPIEASHSRALDFQRVHQRDDINRQHRLLAVAERLI